MALRGVVKCVKHLFADAFNSKNTIRFDIGR